MMINRTPAALALLALALVATGCTSISSKIDQARFGDNPYLEQPFYTRYLSADNSLDQKIQARLDALRSNPDSPSLHNELGALLVNKGFPKDAEREYMRAIANDEDFYPAWYNLALLRESRGDYAGSSRAVRRTLDIKPGHSSALFQLGLLRERQGRHELAVEAYAEAFRINRSLLNVRTNPRILDTKLADRALLKIYPEEHAERSLQFHPAPSGYEDPSATRREDAADGQESPSREATGKEIVTPAAPVTDPGVQETAPQSEPPPPPQ